MTHKTPEQLYQEAQQSLGYHVAENLLAIVSLPVKALTKAWEAVVGLRKSDTRSARTGDV